MYLKRYDSFHFSKFTNLEVEEVRKYYKDCTQFLNEHNFYSKSDRLIWKLHITGMTEEEIGKKFGVHKSTISRVLTRLTKVMRDG